MAHITVGNSFEVIHKHVIIYTVSWYLIVPVWLFKVFCILLRAPVCLLSFCICKICLSCFHFLLYAMSCNNLDVSWQQQADTQVGKFIKPHKRRSEDRKTLLTSSKETMKLEHIETALLD